MYLASDVQMTAYLFKSFPKSDLHKWVIKCF